MTTCPSCGADSDKIFRCSECGRDLVDIDDDDDDRTAALAMTDGSGVSTSGTDRFALYEVATEMWGKEAQIDMIGEESAELSAEVSRFMRGRSDESDLAEELADVEIMLEQARQILDSDLIDEAKEQKLERLKRRLQEVGANV